MTGRDRIETEKKIEAESLNDLEKIVKKTREWSLNLVLIGGYAVRAYTKGHRYTKDMDFLTKDKVWKLKNFLESMDYEVRKTNIILAGTRKINGCLIKIHISVNKVIDESTNNEYIVTEEMITDAKTRKIRGYYEEGRKIEVEAPVVCVEDIILLKLMTRKREKDEVDVVSLLKGNRESVNLDRLAQKCSKRNLNSHLRNRIEEFIARMRNRKTEKVWKNWTGTRLSGKEKKEIIRLLKKIKSNLK